MPVVITGSAPSSDRVEAALERIAETCPHVVAKRDHIATLEAEADGAREARIQKLERMHEEARDYENRAYRMRQDGDLSEADEERVAKWEERAKDIKRARHEIQQQKLPKLFTLETLDKAIAGIQPHHTYFTEAAKAPDDPDKAAKLLDRNRNGRGDLIAIRRKIELAPLPVDVAERLAREQIRTIAKNGGPDVSELFRVQKHHRGRIRFASHFVHVPGGGRDEPDAWSTFVWLHEKELTRRIVEMIRERAPEGALTFEERPDKLAELDAQILALEYEEESLICVLESSGRHKVARRHDANPFAVLQIKRGEDLKLSKRVNTNVWGGDADGALSGVPVTQTKWAGSVGGKK